MIIGLELPAPVNSALHFPNTKLVATAPWFCSCSPTPCMLLTFFSPAKSVSGCSGQTEKALVWEVGLQHFRCLCFQRELSASQSEKLSLPLNSYLLQVWIYNTDNVILVHRLLLSPWKGLTALPSPSAFNTCSGLSLGVISCLNPSQKAAHFFCCLPPSP